MNCSGCGAPIPPGATLCRKCGKAVEFVAPSSVPPSAPAAPPAPVNVVIQMGPGAQVDPYVGQMPLRVAGAPRSKIAAGLLGIFLGCFGAHRFYLGYNGLGLAQLLITLLSCFYGLIVTVPWGIVEGIMILTGQISQDAWGRPLTD